MHTTIDAAVLGGDRRFRILAGLLAADGHRVRISQCAMPDGDTKDGLTVCGSPRDAAESAQAVVLPLPVLGADGRLNAPGAESSAARARGKDSSAVVEPASRTISGLMES